MAMIVAPKNFATRHARKLLLNFWNDECGLTCELQDRYHADVQIYPHNPYQADGDGVEYAVILKRRPQGNMLRFDLDSWGLNFFHQPALSLAQISRGHHRPEHVVNSYAIYHKTKSGHCIGKTNYRNGKAAHLYRSWSQDAKGWRVWNRMRYRDCELRIQIPQKFLDQASYPIFVDPTFTFGHTSIGASSTVLGDTECRAYRHSVGEAGTITKFSTYLNTSIGFVAFRNAIYSNTGSPGEPDGLLAEGSTASNATTTPSWIDITASYAFTAGTYHLAYYAEAMDEVTVYYDTGSTDQQSTRTSLAYPTFPDPFVANVQEDFVISLYVEYTTAGGGGTLMGQILT